MQHSQVSVVDQVGVASREDLGRVKFGEGEVRTLLTRGCLAGEGGGLYEVSLSLLSAAVTKPSVSLESTRRGKVLVLRSRLMNMGESPCLRRAWIPVSCCCRICGIIAW
jgi:hypothetical protein